MISHRTAYCSKCDRLQAMDEDTLHVEKTVLVDRPARAEDGARRLVKTQQLIAHTTATLICGHHVTTVRPA